MCHHQEIFFCKNSDNAIVLHGKFWMSWNSDQNIAKCDQNIAKWESFGLAELGIRVQSIAVLTLKFQLPLLICLILSSFLIAFTDGSKIQMCWKDLLCFFYISYNIYMAICGWKAVIFLLILFLQVYKKQHMECSSK